MNDEPWFGPAELNSTHRLEDYLVPPPSPGIDVCPSCKSWRHERYPMCSNCMEIEHDLGKLHGPIVPISLYRKESQVRNILKFYKEADGTDAMRGTLESIFLHFLRSSKSVIERDVGPLDLATTVPSSRRPRPHPLDRIVESPLSETLGIPLLHIEATNVRLDHREAMAGAFSVPPRFAGRRVLLVDDVYTTGAHAQSAASAIEAAGGKVAAILVAARRVNPDFNEAALRVWQRQSRIQFEFARSTVV